MKVHYHIMKLLVLALMMMSLSGCLDIFFKTEVHPNGQIDKTIILEGDSTSILQTFIPAVKDDSWYRKWEVIEDDEHRLSLTKSFNNFRDFNSAMNPHDSLPKIRVRAELNKKFRWFFSYIDYEEFLLPNNPFDRLDWKEFLSVDEAELIAMDEEERENDPRYSVSNWKETEAQFERYLYRSGFEEFYHYFKNAAKNSPESEISIDLLESKKEEIYDKMLSKGNLEETDDFLEHFSAVLDSTGVEIIVKNNSAFIGYFGTKIDFFNECLDDNYFFSIKMPGLLIDTNSEQIEGSTLSWEVDFFDFYFNGLEMKAESRIINTWAFVVAGVVVLALFIGLFWNVFRRKR